MLWASVPKILAQGLYHRVELNYSEHKPVFSFFQSEIKTVDKMRIEQLKSLFGETFDRRERAKHAERIEEKIKAGICQVRT